MKRNTPKLLLATIATLFMSAPAGASFQPIKGKLVKAPIVDMEIGPNGEVLRAVAQYPNGCYSPWSNAKESNNDTLTLVHIARHDTSGACTDALEYREIKFSIDKLDDGTYEVVDGSDGERLGFLDVDGENTDTSME